MENENTPWPGISDAIPAQTSTSPEPTANSGWASLPQGGTAVVDVRTYEVKYVGQPSTEDPEAFRLRRNAEIQHWLTSKENLGNAKTDESGWRAKVTGTLFPTPKKGTQRYDIGGGYKVKLVYVLAYSIGDKDKVDESGQKVPIRDQVEELEARVAEMGEAHRIAFESVVSWKPEVSGSAYEKLNANDPIQLQVKLAIDELLTIKPGSPQLEFEEPKEAK